MKEKICEFIVQIKAALIVDTELGEIQLEIDPKQYSEDLLEELR